VFEGGGREKQNKKMGFLVSVGEKKGAQDPAGEIRKKRPEVGGGGGGGCVVGGWGGGGGQILNKKQKDRLH